MVSKDVVLLALRAVSTKLSVLDASCSIGFVDFVCQFQLSSDLRKETFVLRSHLRLIVTLSFIEVVDAGSFDALMRLDKSCSKAVTISGV